MPGRHRNAHPCATRSAKPTVWHVIHTWPFAIQSVCLSTILDASCPFDMPRGRNDRAPRTGTTLSIHQVLRNLIGAEVKAA